MKTLTKKLCSAFAATFIICNFANALECTNQLSAEARVDSVGSYNNMRYTSEHQYGYSIELWRSGNCFFGFFSASEGLQGDTPTGLLENVSYNIKTGKFSFNARLSMGMTLNPKDSTWIPSKELYKFRGILDRKIVHGTLLMENPDLKTVSPKKPEMILLKLSAEDTKNMDLFVDSLESEPNGIKSEMQTFSKWSHHADRILKFRGPRW